MKKVQSVQGFSDSRKYLCWAFEASNRGLSKSPRLHTKKSKASKELKGKNDFIGWWQSISGWTEFLGRLDALDAHFRDRVSEYDKIWKKSKESKDSQTPAIIFAGHLKPRIAVYQKVQGSIQKSPKRPKNWREKMIWLVDGRASDGQSDSLDAWTLWTLILETVFQNVNNNIKLGALGFNFGTLGHLEPPFTPFKGKLSPIQGMVY